jgi:tetratricopeptide (TPR) repeat protein
MRAPGSGRARRWKAGGILALFAAAVAGAASLGWWFARESPPHQGPIVLISIGGVPAPALAIYGARRSDTPAIDALAADAVVFEYAYTHSPQALPAHASILSGRLPVEHGVRDDAGFQLKSNVPTLAELLRNRGFRTGAAVSSFLLRPESGIARGFTFFDAELPAPPTGEPAAIDRAASGTAEAAERWIEARRGRRLFLFLHVNGVDADLAVGRIIGRLKEAGLYDDATVVLVGDRGDVGTGMTLDEDALRVPLLVKQPHREGAGRRVRAPVQHIDLVPTILDLVRAPVPGGLRGRSLRRVLNDEEAELRPAPIYAESLAAHLRFGGHPLFALRSDRHRYVRGAHEDLIPVVPYGDDGGGGLAETGRLRAVLDDILGSERVGQPSRMAPADEDRYALLGYLDAPLLEVTEGTGLSLDEERALVARHRAAAVLVGQKRYSAGVRALQAIVHAYPRLTSVHLQLGLLLLRSGRLEEAVDALRTAREARPDSGPISLALADALMRAGQTAAARLEADEAVRLAGQGTAPERAAAHEIAARVALAVGDREAATGHADAAEAADSTRPIRHFVRGRILYDEGMYEEALAAFEQAVASLGDDAAVAELHQYHGETLAHLNRYQEAEAQYRRELEGFPHSLRTYASLAMLYRASNRDADVEDVLTELVRATPTPEGYASAARLWSILGDRSRADALRSAARARFRGDPSLARLGLGGPR